MLGLRPTDIGVHQEVVARREWIDRTRPHALRTDSLIPVVAKAGAV